MVVETPLPPPGHPIRNQSAEGVFARPSLDPIVAQVHTLREQQWQLFGDDSQAWFDALLLSQARRINALPQTVHPTERGKPPRRGIN
jgi:hypothetical protein